MHAQMSEDTQIVFLKSYPQWIETLATWAFEEWRVYDPTLTLEKMLEKFQSRLNDDHLPMTLVALKNGVPVGTLSLKTEESEFSKYSQNAPWGGSFYVLPALRGLGIGTALLRAARNLLLGLGYQEIYLYSSVAAAVQLYEKKGAVKVDRIPFRGSFVTILKAKLA